VSDQDFFFDEDETSSVKADKSSPKRSSAKQAPRPAAKSTPRKSAPSAKNASRKPVPTPENGQSVSTTIALLFAIVSLFLGMIIGLFFSTLMHGTPTVTGSTTVPPSSLDQGSGGSPGGSATTGGQTGGGSTTGGSSTGGLGQ
jgi:hypothetical protein